MEGECTGANLAREVALRLDDAGLCSRQAAAQYAALDKMGRGGLDPSEAAAEAVLKVLAGCGGA